MLPKILKFLQGTTKLTENFEEERRPDLLAAVKRDGHGSSISMVPAFVAAGLSRDVVAKSREPLGQFIPTDVAG